MGRKDQLNLLIMTDLVEDLQKPKLRWKLKLEFERFEDLNKDGLRD